MVIIRTSFFALLLLLTGCSGDGVLDALTSGAVGGTFSAEASTALC